MKRIKYLLIVLVIIIAVSCQQSHNSKEESYSVAVSPNSDDNSINKPSTELNGSSASGVSSGKNESRKMSYISSTAALENKDTNHIFIRTADMHFRVKNVFNSTISIEDIVLNNGGFVISTSLHSNMENTDITAISADSSLESIYYTVVNNMRIKIPVANLHKTMLAMAEHIDYLNYRNINAKDITLDIVANKLKQKRLANYRKRLAKGIDNKGNKLKAIENAEQNLLNKQESIDNALITSLQIIDQVELSTISLNIYQSKVVKRTVIENFKNIEAYQPSFLQKFITAIIHGWVVLKSIIVGLTSVWPLLLIIAALWIAYRKYWRRKE